MSDHEAKAREIATEYETMCVSSGIGRPFGFSGLYLMIAEALRTVRRETLEEAAKVAEANIIPGHNVQAPSMMHVAQAIRSLAVKEGAAQWQDISTAPKDGTWFLICRDDEGFDSYEIGCYEPLTHDRFEPAEGGLYRKVPVKILDHRGFNNFHRATHWMPLPAPPAVKEGEGV